MFIDIELLKKAISFLRDPQDEMVEAAAMVMLKMNRKQVLYRNIMVRPKYLKKTLIYELKKCVDERIPKLSQEQRELMAGFLEQELTDSSTDETGDSDEKKAEDTDGTDNLNEPSDKDVMDSVAEAVKTQPGQRNDHDKLPAEVQELFNGSKNRWFEMKDLHYKLQTMDSATPAERAPLTSKLRRLFTAYRKCLNSYDHFDASAKAEAPKENIAQKVAAARKYLSDNREKLAAAIEADEKEKVAKLREKMQQRIDIILGEDLGFDPQIKEALIKLGLHFN